MVAVFVCSSIWMSTRRSRYCCFFSGSSSISRAMVLPSMKSVTMAHLPSTISTPCTRGMGMPVSSTLAMFSASLRMSALEKSSSNTLMTLSSSR